MDKMTSFMLFSIAAKKEPLEQVRPREKIHYTISRCLSWMMGFNHVNFGVAQMEAKRWSCCFPVFIVRKYQKKKFGLNFKLVSLK